MGRGRGDYSLRRVTVMEKGDNVSRSTINNNFIEHTQSKREPSASSGVKETGKIQTSRYMQEPTEKPCIWNEQVAF